ncbi:hypothetical protein KUTeg_013914 [Tegillarca granosa]|uniref:Uncharacterized protein n=1 Tax=Tegillarca granosa TaxID=220873 RepID=A0ABQ9EYW0_TEGGR|nr:hypothetical protein KUTeg_013914 [Tegillarca granosa]
MMANNFHDHKHLNKDQRCYVVKETGTHSKTGFRDMGLTGSQPKSEKEMEEEAQKLQDDIKSKVTETFELLKQQWEINKKLQSDLEKLTVQMFSAVNQKLCQIVESELFTMLATHLETMNVNIQKEPCLHPQDHHDDVPLIVLCVNASRLGTDVTQALSNVTYNSSVAVAILHHKEFHALPSQASEKLLIGQDYKKLGLIVDIAFLTTKGMYPCELNNRSIDRLCQFISAFTT